MGNTILDTVRRTISEKNYSAATVASAIGYSSSSLSLYLADKYPASAARLEAALVPWLRREGATLAAGGDESRVVDTKAVRAIVEACTEAQEQGLIAAIIGAPGLGKTFGLRAYEAQARRAGVRFISITATVATNAISIVRAIASALRLKPAPMAQLIDAIIEKLNREPSFMIIDEAQHLNARALESVRAIHDATMTGVVFAGSLQLSLTLEAGDGTTLELAQIQDRVAVIEHLAVLSPAEVGRFIRQWYGAQVEDADAVAAIREVSRGVPRRLVRLLGHCRKLSDGSPKALSAELVREAAKRLVVA